MKKKTHQTYWNILEQEAWNKAKRNTILLLKTEINSFFCETRGNVGISRDETLNQTRRNKNNPVQG